jgi:hypothetical protein
MAADPLAHFAPSVTVTLKRDEAALAAFKQQIAEEL